LIDENNFYNHNNLTLKSEIMKYCYLTNLFFFLIMSIDLFGLNNDSINKVDVIQNKSINVNPAIVIGNEIGLSARIEYEKSSFGKLFLTGSAGLLFNSNSYLMLDLGFGYGYPMISSKNNSLYLSSQLSMITLGQPVGLPNSDFGSTGLIEVEYRKKWSNFSICFSPYLRGLLLFHKSFGSDNTTTKGLVDFGLRIGCAYNFSLLKK
jgi:hypothetical protein